MLDKLFILIRELILPTGWLVRYFPKSGNVLDVGCGHGALVHKLSVNKKLRITGIDPSKEKINKAINLFADENVTFLNTQVEKFDKKNFDAVSVVDVLYLLPEQECKSILRKIHLLLKRNSIILLCETEPNFFINTQEFIATKLIRYTYNSSHSLNFKSINDYNRLLDETGYHIQKQVNFNRLIYKHTLFVATKNS